MKNVIEHDTNLFDIYIYKYTHTHHKYKIIYSTLMYNITLIHNMENCLET